MIKKTVTYKDYDGVEQTEDFFFHLSKADIIKMELSHKGGLEESLKNIIVAKDGETIMKEFENFLNLSVGKRDGDLFVRDDVVRNRFFQTNAYEALLMELVLNADTAAEFIRGIAPPNMIEEAAKAAEVAKTQAPEINIETPAPRIITRDELVEATGDEFRTMAEKIATGEIVVED